MTARTTSTSAYAWRPDETFFAANEVVAPALILQTSTIAGAIEGDAQAVKVAYVEDAEADYYLESASISESDPALSEVVVQVKTIKQLVKVSNQQFRLEQTAAQLSQSVARALIKKADSDYVTSAANPVGLANITDTEEAGSLGTDLDGLIDLVAQLESNGATPSHIIVDPLGWASIRKLKTDTASSRNESLLGVGTVDAPKMLLNLPVLVNRFIGAYSGVVLDRNAVVSAVGPVRVATSEHAYFGSDSVGLRATWSIGWNIVRPNWVGSFDLEPGT